MQGNFQDRFYVRNQELSGDWEVLIIPPGDYASIKAILSKMKELVDNEKRFNDDVRCSYDTLSRKVTVHLQNNAKLFFGDVGHVLRFSPKEVISQTSTSEREADIDYCDIVQPQYVGDALVRLLRIVPVEGLQGEDGQRVSKSFLRPQYIHVSRKQFESIEVNIKRDTGDSVPFEFERV